MRTTPIRLALVTDVVCAGLINFGLRPKCAVFVVVLVAFANRLFLPLVTMPLEEVIFSGVGVVGLLDRGHRDLEHVWVHISALCDQADSHEIAIADAVDEAGVDVTGPYTMIRYVPVLRSRVVRG